MKKIFVYPRYPKNLSRLYTLAYNLWSTWNYDAINLFYRIDAKAFREMSHNPVRFLISLPGERVAELSKDRGFLFELDRVWEKYRNYLDADGRPCDAEKAYGFGSDDVIAYFLMEFGVHESIPIYAGGLGILSGDFLKGSSDMGLNVVGIGLFYKYGYFTQRINPAGYQEEVFETFEKLLLPIKLVRDKEGTPVTVEVRVLGEPVAVRIWEMAVGRARAFLLDTDTDENPPHLRPITHELYVANPDQRIRQEMVLALGGMKALDVLGIRPKIYHLNEGHSAFLVIARLRELIRDGFPFAEARAIIRQSTVFTTHTPVIAGNENFPTPLVRTYLEPELRETGLPFDALAPLGFVNGDTNTFWLPAFAINFSRYVNAVSLLHRDVSRKMWSPLFPNRDLSEVPIDHVTNGIHMSWLSEPFTDMFNRHIGPEYIYCGEKEDVWERILEIPDDEIWDAHRKNKQSLVAFARRQLMDAGAAAGSSHARIRALTHSLNQDFLTIVFAKRFAPYKRANLVLRDRDRLKKILSDARKPVQFIFAGKAHPADVPGKNIIKEILDFARDYDVEDRVIFLENYDLNVARHLVWGADVWLNTPVKFMEASGTSGMKAAVNGVLHMSVPDGWWAEGYNGGNGWAITAGEAYADPGIREAAEAGQIYNLIEEEVSELFYDRNESGVPEQWVRMMKEAMYSVCRQFNMNRVIANYIEKFFAPARAGSAALAADGHRAVREAGAREALVMKHWPSVAVLSVSSSMDRRDHLVEGDAVTVECDVSLGDAPPEIFAVELCYRYDGRNDIVPMSPVSRDGGTARYACSFDAAGRGPQTLAVRVRPADPILQDMHPDLIRTRE